VPAVRNAGPDMSTADGQPTLTFSTSTITFQGATERRCSISASRSQFRVRSWHKTRIENLRGSFRKQDVGRFLDRWGVDSDHRHRGFDHRREASEPVADEVDAGQQP